jgi:broad specificity phosphatase PhoE
MQRILRYITHPQIIVDPSLPVPQWHLSAQGRERVQQMNVAAFGATKTIISSAEVKAVETAQIISNQIGVSFQQRPAMHENDRSSTGFLPSDEFEKMADAFFAEPNKCVRGWESALDAQARIVAETIAILDENPISDILLIGHGAVGTLLYCHYADLPIDRGYDQPDGGGNYFTVDLEAGIALHHWKPIELMSLENTDG